MISYRNATRAEINEILDWAAQEGWNPGLDDAAPFFAADPNGFFVASDASGRLMAAISVVNHTPDFAFLGLYIVRPDCRGQGIGLGLWRHALDHAGDRTIGLDGVEAQQENYKASGFVHAGGTTRFSGHVSGAAHAEVRFATPHDTSRLIAKEAAASGVAKPAYMEAWLAASPSRSTLVSEGKGGIDGFCTVRACRSGAKIGPLVADDAGVARRLIAHAAQLFDGPITLDVPETATGLTGICQELKLDAGFKTARMYRGAISTPSHAHFAVVCLELG